MKYKYIFFDLDGTLLETLNDILLALNNSLDYFNYPLHYEYDDGKKLIGNGARKLMERALFPLNPTEEMVDEFSKIYLPNYLKYQGETTKPFEGVVDTLLELNKFGIKLGIITNKPQPMTDAIVKKLLPDVFIELIGQSDRFKVKPDTEVMDYMIQKYHINKSDILFVGDSIVDVTFANNCGIDSAFCEYGYATDVKEASSKATYSLKSFDELLTIIK